LKKLLSSVTGAYNTIDYIRNKMTSAPPSEMTADKSTLSGYVSKINNDISTVTNVLASITSAQDSSARRTSP